MSVGTHDHTSSANASERSIAAGGGLGPVIVSQLKRFTWGHVVFLSALVGVVSGLGGVAFNFMVDTADRYAMADAAGYVAPHPGAEGGPQVVQMPRRRWMLMAMPALGGLLAGLLVFSLAPEAEGHGTDAVVRAFHHGRGVIRARVPIVKTIASAITIGSGGSAGREGPIGQIGAGFGSALASWLRVGDRERRLLMLAGGGAGIGAVFRAPLGGALFMAEVLYQDMEFESAALVPTFVAAIVAYSIYCFIYASWGPIFNVPALHFTHPVELPLYVVLGVLCAVVGWLYVRVFYGVRDLIFAPMRRVPPHLKPMIGGLAVGLIGWFFPQALGMGYGWTQLAIDGMLSVKVLALIVLVKIMATGLTISSGGSGGVFGPSIVIGGCLGALYGSLLHRLMPATVTQQPATFALVGMAGFFAGVAKAPISSLVMVSEMTEGYGLLVPLMLTTAVAYMLLPRRVTIYEEQMPSRASSPAHEGEFTLDVLEAIRVADALRPVSVVTFAPSTPLRDVLTESTDTRQRVFPIVDGGRGLVGVVSVDDLRIFLTERAVPPDLLVASDLRAPEYRTVAPDEDLASALRKLYATGLDELPVMTENGDRRVTAMLSRRDIMSVYYRRMYGEDGAKTSHT
ncbi:MAG TPA: chloride channel protein [Tepidisphaeraceae bacterium]|jgi:CIC family chloride channel protein